MGETRVERDEERRACEVFADLAPESGTGRHPIVRLFGAEGVVGVDKAFELPRRFARSLSPNSMHGAKQKDREAKPRGKTIERFHQNLPFSNVVTLNLLSSMGMLYVGFLISRTV